MIKSKKRKYIHQKSSNYLFFTLLLIMLVTFVLKGFLTLAKESEAEKTLAYKYFTSIEIEREDTLWSIANTYITDEYASVEDYISEVKKINALTSDTISYGQYLTVPYYSDEKK